MRRTKRTGEIFALQWRNVDLQRRVINVCELIDGPVKDKQWRVAPILDQLLPVLTEWKLKSGGEGRVIPSFHRDGVTINKTTASRYLRRALAELKLDQPGLGW